MAATVWKGVLSFGLVAIPVRLVRAARPERVKFHQVRVTAPRLELRDEERDEAEEPNSPAEEPGALPPMERVQYAPVAASGERSIPREEIRKGYEYEPGRFVALEPERLQRIAPQTSRDMAISEFVKLDGIDPVFFETSYYVLPEKAGERAYALLFAGLRKTGYSAVAGVAMHRREHVVIIRAGSTGLVLHTMFYVDEVRAENEAKADLNGITAKEMKLAKAFIESLAGTFEPGKYKDAYRERVKSLIDAQLVGKEAPVANSKQLPVLNIVAALEKSLEVAKKPATMSQNAAKLKRLKAG